MTEEEVLRYKVKVCLLGDESVGKSSLIRRFVLDEFSDDYIPTLGTKITKHEVAIQHQGKDVHLVMLIYDINGHWSTLGQTIEDFTQLIPANYISNAEGLMLVCDLTNRESFYNYEFWQDNVLKALGKDVPSIFLGNKSDLVDDIKVTNDDIQGLIDERQATFLMTSAKTGKNVEEAFGQLARMIVGNLMQG
jgi:Ras-related protein Rab-6A